MTGGILTDGVVTLRPSTPHDAPLIIAARDAAFRRFIGQGSAVPAPKFVIVVHGLVVGWVDHDRDDDRWWLAPEEVNIGYHVFPEHRGRGHATRAVHLMLEHVRADTDCEVATLTAGYAGDRRSGPAGVKPRGGDPRASPSSSCLELVAGPDCSRTLIDRHLDIADRRNDIGLRNPNDIPDHSHQV